MSRGPDQIVVVLGCKVQRQQPSAALLRRLERAHEVSKLWPELAIIFSGGRIWAGTSESEAMASWWARHGTDAAVVCENHSLTTLENARRVSEMCAAQNIQTVHLVTSDLHMPRATRLFQNTGLTVIPHCAPSPASGAARMRAQIREWGARLLSPIESWIK